MLLLTINSIDPRPVITKEPPAAAGDLVLVQIDMRTSVEGHTLREDNSSYCPPDLSVTGEYWEAPFRPALILSRKACEGGRYSFWIVPLTKLTPEGASLLKEIVLMAYPILFRTFLPMCSPVRWRYILFLIKCISKFSPIYQR